MREEEYDWAIYHVITGEKRCGLEMICEQSGFPREIVEQSLERLVARLLISNRGDLYQACSIEEFMISNQMKHDPLSDIIIENGIVKVKSPELRTPDESRNTGGSA